MENYNSKETSYSKRPLWFWILLYVIIGGIAYFLIYYLFFYKTGSYAPYGYQGANNNSSVQAPQYKILDLSNKGLTSVPANVFNQTNIEELNISYNSLTGALPSQIGNLVNLKILNASYNKMTGVPAEIGQLQNLQILDLSYNQLTGLPYELGNLNNLQTLNLKGNSYSQQDLNYIRSKLPSTVTIITE